MGWRLAADQWGRGYPAAMDLVDSLRGPAGPAAYQTGMSPAEAALTLASHAADRPHARSGCDPLSLTHLVQSVEVYL